MSVKKTSRTIPLEIVDVPEPELLCRAIHKLFLYGNKDRASEKQLFFQTDKLVSWFRTRSADPDVVAPVIELERQIILANGANKQFVEESLFKCLDLVVSSWEPDDDHGDPTAPQSAIDEAAVGIAERERHEIAATVLELCREVLQLSIPRDRFNSQRKALALRLVGVIATHVEIDGVLEIVKEAVGNKKDVVADAGIDIYRSYLQRRKAKPTPDMLKLLDAIVEKTTSRSVAVGALDLQVKTGVIHELEALSRIDEWKEKNRRRSSW